MPICAMCGHNEELPYHIEGQMLLYSPEAGHTVQKTSFSICEICLRNLSTNVRLEISRQQTIIQQQQKMIQEQQAAAAAAREAEMAKRTGEANPDS